jgi:hypothetical protein
VLVGWLVVVVGLNLQGQVLLEMLLNQLQQERLARRRRLLMQVRLLFLLLFWVLFHNDSCSAADIVKAAVLQLLHELQQEGNSTAARDSTN